MMDQLESQERIEKSIDKSERERPDSPGLFHMLNNSGMSRNQFNYHYVIGKGGFGKVRNFIYYYFEKYLKYKLFIFQVWKVDMKKNKQLFAMKEMSKAK